MAGHNKWSKIKRAKGKNDAQRGRLFTRLAREITMAAKQGGGDPDYNFALRAAIDRAKMENLPANNIDRAIARGTGEDGAVDFQEVIYEGYGPQKVALLVRCLTDNRNRTVGEVRSAFRKAGLSLGESGSVAWMFDHRGLFTYEPGADEDAIMEAAIEGGAEDVSTNEDGEVEVICAVEDFANVRSALDAAGHDPNRAELAYLPNTPIPVDADQLEQVVNFIDILEEIDDVQEVTPNFEITGDVGG